MFVLYEITNIIQMLHWLEIFSYDFLILRPYNKLNVSLLIILKFHKQHSTFDHLKSLNFQVY